MAWVVGIQDVKVGNVLGGRTTGVRGASLHVRNTSLSGMVIKVRVPDLVVMGAALGEMATMHGRADARGLMNVIGARGLCCEGYQGVYEPVSCE